MHDNLIIAILLIVGIAALIAAYLMDRWSSFDNGGFMIQIVLIIAGGVAIVMGLVWKFVLAFL